VVSAATDLPITDSPIADLLTLPWCELEAHLTLAFEDEIGTEGLAGAGNEIVEQVGFPFLEQLLQLRHIDEPARPSPSPA